MNWEKLKQIKSIFKPLKSLSNEVYAREIETHEKCRFINICFGIMSYTEQVIFLLIFRFPKFHISPTPSFHLIPALRHRPNSNTYQNITVLRINISRTNITLKFPNGTMTNQQCDYEKL
jgi:hypothetical protein